MNMSRVVHIFSTGLLMCALLSSCAPRTGETATGATDVAAQPTTNVVDEKPTAQVEATLAPQPSAQPTIPVATQVPTQPTAEQPTAVPQATPVPQPTSASQAGYPTEPAAVVQAFLSAFGGGLHASDDPKHYVGGALRKQVEGGYPLNLMLGVQNMFTGFEVGKVDAPDANGAVAVHATLTYGEPMPWTFMLAKEADQWRINSITDPDQHTRPEVQQGVIYFVGADGMSIQAINADGSNMEVIEQHASDQPIDYLGATPDGQGLLVGAAGQFFTLSGAVRVDVGSFAGAPRWSPDGMHLAGQSLKADGSFGPVTVFDFATRQSKVLPLTGRADWFPDGQALVVAATGDDPNAPGSNIVRYDLANGKQTKLTNLVSTESDIWYVQEAHVLPGGKQIVFYGNHTSEVGASGNGQQWWWIPVGGGEQQLYSENFGNGINDYAPSGDGTKLAYSSGAHVSACASAGDIVVRPIGTENDPHQVTRPPVEMLSEDAMHYTAVQGLNWSPNGAQLAFGLTRYTCADASQDPVKETPKLYVWSIGGPAYTIAEGNYPVWLAQPLPMPGP